MSLCSLWMSSGSAGRTGSEVSMDCVFSWTVMAATALVGCRMELVGQEPEPGVSKGFSSSQWLSLPYQVQSCSLRRWYRNLEKPSFSCIWWQSVFGRGPRPERLGLYFYAGFSPVCMPWLATFPPTVVSDLLVTFCQFSSSVHVLGGDLLGTPPPPTFPLDYLLALITGWVMVEGLVPQHRTELALSQYGKGCALWWQYSFLDQTSSLLECLQRHMSWQWLSCSLSVQVTSHPSKCEHTC